MSVHSTRLTFVLLRPSVLAGVGGDSQACECRGSFAHDGRWRSERHLHFVLGGSRSSDNFNVSLLYLLLSSCSLFFPTVVTEPPTTHVRSLISFVLHQVRP